MSRLDELIQQFCPDGVRYVALESVCQISKGVQFNKKDMREDGTYPVINGGINPSGYIEQYNQDENTVTISQGGASAGYVNWLEVKFWAGAHCYILAPTEAIINRYLYHFVKSKERKLQECQYGAGIPALAKSTVSTLKIPLPPMEVQQEIVRILDQFTELTAELTAKLNAELTARKKQYEYYRDELLHKKSFFDVRECRLGEVADIHTGSKPDEILEEHSEFEYINAGTTNSGYTKMPNCPGDTVTTPSRGQGGIGFVGYQSQPFHLGPLCYAIRSSDENFIINKFIYYWLSSHTGDILAFKKEGGTPALNRGDLTGLKLCVPHIAVQRRIVEILDRFNFLRYNLTSGLPAEIEARRKQYEYYRDKVLTFEKI